MECEGVWLLKAPVWLLFFPLVVLAMQWYCSLLCNTLLEEKITDVVLVSMDTWSDKGCGSDHVL